jgi:hypothetical protein
MINRFTQWLLGLARKRDKKRYLRLLDEFEAAEVKPRDMPILLRALWRELHLPYFCQMDTRELMEHQISLRHPTITTLIGHLHNANDWTAGERDLMLETFSKNELQIFLEVGMDMYFLDEHRQSVDVHASLVRVRSLIQAHCEILDSVEGAYPQRMLQRLYYEAYSLARVLVQTM